jgi:hypothetical protein
LTDTTPPNEAQQAAQAAGMKRYGKTHAFAALGAFRVGFVEGAEWQAKRQEQRVSVTDNMAIAAYREWWAIRFPGLDCEDISLDEKANMRRIIAAALAVPTSEEP